MPPPRNRNLYIGCAIDTMPHSKAQDFLRMVKKLKKLLQGEFVLTIASAVYSLSAKENYWRDIHEDIGIADAMVVLCDYPSTRLGYEMAVAIEKRNIPVLALASYKSKVSLTILGIHGREKKKKFNFVRYHSMDDVPGIIKDEFEIRKALKLDEQ